MGVWGAIGKVAHTRKITATFCYMYLQILIKTVERFFSSHFLGYENVATLEIY